MINRRKFIKTASAQLLINSSLAVLFKQAHAAPINGVSYGANRLDIYPASSGVTNAPVVIYVHGGAWRRGSRRRVGAKAKYFTRTGRLFVSVDYTLFPKADIRTQARQIGQAVGWVRANAATYGGNPGRIALMGHSAGCHLAALATLSGSASGVRALICIDTAAYDIPYLAKLNGGRLPSLYRVLNFKNKWVSWSPITYANRGPPTLIAWSRGKNREKISRHFASKLGRGTSVTLFDGSGYGHGSINSSIGAESGGITAAIERFLRRTVG